MAGMVYPRAVESEHWYTGLPGQQFAVDGDPLKDLSSLRNVVLVLKEGEVVVNRL
jgi:hypothetical protein